MQTITLNKVDAPSLAVSLSELAGSRIYADIPCIGVDIKTPGGVILHSVEAAGIWVENDVSPKAEGRIGPSPSIRCRLFLFRW